MTAAAPISEETLSYFLSVNIVLYELYGMTETTGPTTISAKNAVRYRAAGKIPDGIKLSINKPDTDGQGEVANGMLKQKIFVVITRNILIQLLINGRHVFMGYLRNPGKTVSEFTDDGWLKSGDIGYIDKVKNL